MGNQPELTATNPRRFRAGRALLAVVVIGGWLLFAVAFVVGNVAFLYWVGFSLDALYGLTFLDVLVVGGMGKITMGLVRATEKRSRRHKYIICGDDYADAPRHIKDTMQQLFKSAQSLRTSRAYREGMREGMFG